MTATEHRYAEQAREAHLEAVHLIDTVAIERALMGSPVALRELEQGAVIALADLHGLHREITAAGLGIGPDTLSKRIARARERLPAARLGVLAASLAFTARALVDAVHADDAESVERVLTRLDRQSLAALAVVLADRIDPASLADPDDEPDT